MDFYAPNTSDLNYLHFLNENANLSLKNRDQMCQIAKGFRMELKILFIVGLQTVASLSTLVLLALLYKDREIRRLMNIINLDLKAGFFWFLILNLNRS
jgi:hypothetical protein